MLQVFDRIMVSLNALSLLLISIITLYFYFINYLAEKYKARILSRFSIYIESHFRRPALHYYLNSYNLPNRISTVEIESSIQNLKNWVGSVGLVPILELPYIPIFYVALYLLHPYIFLAAVLLSGVLFLIVRLYARRKALAASDLSIEQKSINEFNFFNLRHSEAIRVNGMVEGTINRFMHIQSAHDSNNYAFLKGDEGYGEVGKQFRVLSGSLVLALGAILVIDHSLTMGGMIAASFLVARATSPFDTLISSWTSFKTAQRDLDLLERLEAGQNESEHRPLDDDLTGYLSSDDLFGSPKVQLGDLSFSFPSDLTPLVQNVSYVFDSGIVYVIQGPNGVGKSTLLNLIAGNLRPTLGTVNITYPNDKSIRDTMGRVSFLDQIARLPTASVLENLTWFGETPKERVYEMAIELGIHSTILKLKSGYDTIINTAEGSLSGGQIQLLRLTRNLSSSRSIYLLDEPDSHLDVASKNRLFDCLGRISKNGKVVIMVSHTPDIARDEFKVLTFDGHNIT